MILNFEQSSLQKRDIYKKRKKLILNNKSKNLLSYTAMIRSWRRYTFFFSLCYTWNHRSRRKESRQKQSNLLEGSLTLRWNYEDYSRLRCHFVLKMPPMRGKWVLVLNTFYLSCNKLEQNRGMSLAVFFRSMKIQVRTHACFIYVSGVRWVKQEFLYLIHSVSLCRAQSSTKWIKQPLVVCHIWRWEELQWNMTSIMLSQNSHKNSSNVENVNQHRIFTEKIHILYL